MKLTVWARRALLFAPLLLTACAGFWQNPDGSSSSSSSTTTSSLSSGVFFVLNQARSTVSSYAISAGSLVQATGSPMALASTPFCMAVSPNGNFLYVSTSSGVFAYSIGSGGQLTALSASAISTDTTAYAIAVDRSGSWLLEASAAGYLYAIPISSSTGLNTATSAQQVALPGTASQQIAVSPDNHFLLVTVGTSGSTAVPFTASSSSPFGTPVNIPVKVSGGSAIGVAVDPITSSNSASRLFYIGETAAYSSTTNSGGIRVFDYAKLLASSTVSELAGSPYASAGLAPYALLATADAAYLYAANRTVSGSSTGNLVGFTVSGAGTTASPYTLTQLSSSLTTTAGYYPVSLAQDSTNNYLLLANYGKGTTDGGSPDLAGYNFNSSTAGKLDYVISATTGTDPVGALQVLAIR